MYAPCKGCVKRFRACQDERKCADYKRYREELKKAKEAVKKANGDAWAAVKYSG